MNDASCRKDETKVQNLGPVAFLLCSALSYSDNDSSEHPGLKALMSLDRKAYKELDGTDKEGAEMIVVYRGV